MQDGFTALGLASRGGFIAIVRALLAADPSPEHIGMVMNGRDIRGTSLNIARRNGHLDVVKALEDISAKHKMDAKHKLDNEWKQGDLKGRPFWYKTTDGVMAKGSVQFECPDQVKVNKRGEEAGGDAQSGGDVA